MQRQYLCIDLKSFYASVECVERGLDPMTTDLVVADPERSSKTICLAVSPSLKARGVSGRARVFGGGQVSVTAEDAKSAEKTAIIEEKAALRAAAAAAALSAKISRTEKMAAAKAAKAENEEAK